MNPLRAAEAVYARALVQAGEGAHGICLSCAALADQHCPEADLGNGQWFLRGGTLTRETVHGEQHVFRCPRYRQREERDAE